MEESRENHCRNCGKPTPPSDKIPCPHCGFTPSLNISRSDEIGVGHETVKIRRKKDGEKEFLNETIAGDDFFHDKQEWVKKERSIDWENNWYKERIINLKSGEVIRNVNEPLTSHQNRGSAKYKIPK